MIDLQAGRAGFETINTYPAADHVTRQNTRIAGVPCAWFLPEHPVSDDIVIYIHGGAFIFGSLASHAPLVSHLAHQLKRKVLVIGYRLAPEHPFPSGMNDCVAVIQALYREDQHLRFGIIGDSAGGNLAMATQLKLKEEAGPAAQYTVVISPWVNLACNTQSYDRNKTVDTVLARPYLVEAAALYAAGQPVSTPMLSPVNGDFSGLAPVLILCGTHEILEDDSKQLQERLQSGGVGSVLRLFKDQLHVWPFMEIDTEAAQQALTEITGFVSQHASTCK